jgi:ParB family chromosome partitioning protein
LSDEIDGLTAETSAYSGEDIARAGAFVSIGHDGETWIERGFVRREDEVESSQSTGLDGRRNGDGLG